MHRPRKSPVLLGHESTGIVIGKGTDVTHLDEGDTVLVTWVPRDATNTDTTPSAAILDVDGGQAISQNVFTWADHTIADQQFVVKVDASIKKDVTAIIGCAVMTGAGAVINTANVQRGDSVAIFGVGGVGLSAVVGAKCAARTPSSQSILTMKNWHLLSVSVRHTELTRAKSTRLRASTN